MNNILGLWKSDPEDITTQELYGDIAMEFMDDGRLIYTITAEGKSELIFLTYSIVDNQLITNQPSAPRQEITFFELLGDRLELTLDEIRSRFIRS
jgi:hypothetical protein